MSAIAARNGQRLRGSTTVAGVGDCLRYPLQLALHIAHRLEPFVRVLLEACGDNAIQRRSECGVRKFDRLRAAARGSPQSGRPAWRLECAATREHFIEQAAERPDVRARIDLAPFDLFGRHVIKGAENGTGSGERLRACRILGSAHAGDRAR